MFGIKNTTIFLDITKMYRLTKSITPATITCNPVPYNGSNQIAQNLTVTIDGDTLIENTDYTIITNAGGTDVGTYPIVIQGIEDYVDTASGSFVIVQAQGNADISGASVAYTGSSQNLINVSNNTGTMYYKVGTEGTWSTEIPTATTVGSQTIYYYMEESINYTGRGNIDVPWGSVTATINKADQAAPTATGSTVSYGSTATASYSGGGGFGSIEWSNGNTQSSVGSKTTKVRWTGDSNHNPSPWSNEVTLTVNKASQAAPTAYGSTTTYNTTATASYSGGGGQGSIEWSNGNTQTSVGSKTTQARWSGNAQYDPSPWSNVVTLTMNKANQSAPTAYGASVAYGSTASASASGGGGQGSIEWSNGNSRSAMGSQTTYARWSGNGNYNPSPWSNAVTLTVSKANQSAPTAYGASVSEGSTATASASGGGGHGSIEWSNGNTRTAVGSQTTRARWSGDSYYNASDWSNEVTLTVNSSSSGSGSGTGGGGKSQGYIMISANHLQNTGNYQNLVTLHSSSGTVYYGTYQNWSTSIPTSQNPGAYHIYYYVAESENYYAVGSPESPAGDFWATIGAVFDGPSSITVTPTSGTTRYGFTSRYGGNVYVIAKGPYITSTSIEDPVNEQGYVNFTYSGGSGQTTYITLEQYTTGRTLTTYITLP